MKEYSLQYVGGIIALGLLAWNVSTTQALTVQIARFEADMLQRVSRLEINQNQIYRWIENVEK